MFAVCLAADIQCIVFLAAYVMGDWVLQPLNGAETSKQRLVNPVYSTTPRNGNQPNGNHLDQSLSSPQKNGN